MKLEDMTFDPTWEGTWYTAEELNDLLYGDKKDNAVATSELTKNKEYFFFEGEIEKHKTEFEEKQKNKAEVPDQGIPAEGIDLLAMIMSKTAMPFLVRTTSNSLRFIRRDGL